MFRALPDTPPVLAIGDDELDEIIQEDYLWEDMSERRSAPGEAEEDENFELTEMRFRQPSTLDLEEHLPYRLDLLTSCVADRLLDWGAFRTYFNSNVQKYRILCLERYGARSPGFAYFLRQVTRMEIYMFLEEGQASNALEYATKSYDCHMAVYGTRHVSSIESRSELGEVHYHSGNHREALRLQRMCLATCRILIRRAPAFRPVLPTASIQLRIANALLGNERLSEALTLYYRVKRAIRSGAMTFLDASTELEVCRRQLHRCKLEFRRRYYNDANAAHPIWRTLFPNGW